MEIEMEGGIPEKLLKCHEFAETRVPIGRRTHSAFPILIIERSGLSHPRSIDAVKYLPHTAVHKDFAVHPSAQRIEPIRGFSGEVKQLGKWTRRTPGSASPYGRQRQKNVQDDEPRGNVCQDFTVRPARVETLSVQILF